MKLILLAATALISVPVLAQTTPAAPPAQTAPAGAADQSMTPPPADASTPPADAAAPADPAAAAAPAPADAAPMPQASTPAPMTTGSGSPAGGYAPTGSALSGGTPGSTLPPVFRPAQTPDQAYPAPAPLAKYPVCKKGQYDQCVQRGGK